MERSHPRGQRDLSGSVLDGRYQLVAPLGIGGMGTVYEGVQLTLEKRVAIKVLKAELAADAAYVERFLREAKAAARVGHRNVVAIIDFGHVQDGPIYYVMELLRGIDLSQLIKKRGPLQWRRTRSIILQVLGALEAAHAEGVIHRDVKPANVFLLRDADDDDDEPNDFVKVLDFGIAKLLGSGDLTRADEVVGTASYMAPEQAHGIVDARTDAYSVGVLMYKMLTGVTPFSGVNGFEILRKHQSEPPPTLRSLVPDLSPAVEALVLQALAKRPELRFQSMTEMRAAVRAISPNAAGKRHGIARAEGTPTAVRLITPVSVEPTLEHKAPATEQKTLVPTEVTPQAPPPTATVRDPFIQTERVPEFPPPGVHDAGGWIPEPTGPSGPATFSSMLGDTATSTRPQARHRALLKGIMVGLVVAVVLTLGFVVASLSVDPPSADPPAAGSTGVPASIDPQERPARADARVVIPKTASPDTSSDDPEPSDPAGDADEGGSTGEDLGTPDDGSHARPRAPVTDDSVKRRLVRRAKQKCGATGSGRVEVGFSVRSDGGVMMVVAQAPHADDAMGRCVVGIVSSARFPKGTLRRESISVRL